jgi:hypothetical protein
VGVLLRLVRHGPMKLAAKSGVEPLVSPVFQEFWPMIRAPGSLPGIAGTFVEFSLDKCRGDEVIPKVTSSVNIYFYLEPAGAG